MQQRLMPGARSQASRSEDSPPATVEAAFCQRFKAALLYFVRKGFSVEKCFGFVWEQTLDEVHLPESGQGKVYHELIVWAKGWAR
jgi:hypothetical protein